jgi:uncharacterized protein YndB with AHSA1/START domain
MNYKLESDFPVTDAAAQAATGKTLAQWFAELDQLNGLKLGRGGVGKHLLAQRVDPWWITTIAVEYEKQHGVRKKDGLFEGYFVCSTKTIAVPVAQVYAAWTNNACLSQWLGAGMEAEVKEGGAYANAEGDHGTFLRVRPDKDLRLTFENPAFSAPMQVDVQFQDKGKGKTGVTLNHTRIQTRAEADALRAAWAEALDRLKASCEN